MSDINKKTFEELQADMDHHLEETLKGKRLRVVIEGDAYKMCKAKVTARVCGLGFTVMQEIIDANTRYVDQERPTSGGERV